MRSHTAFGSTQASCADATVASASSAASTNAWTLTPMPLRPRDTSDM